MLCSWAANCAANDLTNGVDVRTTTGTNAAKKVRTMKQAKANIITDGLLSKAVGLPPQFQPTVPATAGSDDAIKSFILPDKKTGVVCIIFVAFNEIMSPDFRWCYIVVRWHLRTGRF